MKFSDTTNKNGIIQSIERYTGLGDAGVSSNSTLLKIITASVNEAFDEIMPLLLSYCDKVRWDDINHADHPIGTVNIVSGQADYFFTEDDNNLDILNIIGVRILPSATETDYVDLERMTLDHPLVMEAMSPNSFNSGTPSHWIENNNTVFLYPEPDYAATNGLQIFFEREQKYFDATGADTREPGIPKPFHRLLPIIVAHEWLLENKPSNTAIITRLEAKIVEAKKQLRNLISTKNPTKARMTPRQKQWGTVAPYI